MSSASQVLHRAVRAAIRVCGIGDANSPALLLSGTGNPVLRKRFDAKRRNVRTDGFADYSHLS